MQILGFDCLPSSLMPGVFLSHRSLIFQKEKSHNDWEYQQTSAPLAKLLVVGCVVGIIEVVRVVDRTEKPWYWATLASLMFNSVISADSVLTKWVFALRSLFSGDSRIGEGSIQPRHCPRRGSSHSVLSGSCNQWVQQFPFCYPLSNHPSKKYWIDHLCTRGRGSPFISGWFRTRLTKSVEVQAEVGMMLSAQHSIPMETAVSCVCPNGDCFFASYVLRTQWGDIFHHLAVTFFRSRK